MAAAPLVPLQYPLLVATMMMMITMRLVHVAQKLREPVWTLSMQPLNDLRGTTVLHGRPNMFFGSSRSLHVLYEKFVLERRRPFVTPIMKIAL